MRTKMVIPTILVFWCRLSAKDPPAVAAEPIVKVLQRICG
jgi:hypothetical protein